MYVLNSTSKTTNYKVENKWIDGFTMFVILVSTGAGLTGTSFIRPDNMQVKGTLYRGKSQYEMFNHTLRQMVILSHLMSPVFNFIQPGNQQAYVLQTSGGVQTAIMPLRFDFGGPLCLIGDDRFMFQPTMNDNFFDSTGNVVAASSYVEFDETETTEVEFYVPITKSAVIEAGQNNLNFSLGSGVMTIILANYDKTTISIANQTLNNIDLSSKQLSKADDWYETITKAYSYYPTPAEALIRANTFIVYDGHDDLDDVNLTLNLNSSNITSSNNWVLTRLALSSDGTITRGTVLAQRKDDELDNKGKFNPALVNGRTKV